MMDTYLDKIVMNTISSIIMKEMLLYLEVFLNIAIDNNDDETIINIMDKLLEYYLSLN